METIVPYKEEFKKYIPEQYKNSEKLLALVNSCMEQFDDIETAFFEILQSLNLADAIGPALDYLGAIVGVKRNPGESDTRYRERIVSGLNLLNLPGPEALRMVIKFLTGVDSVGLFPNWPAEMYYVLDGGTDADLSNLEKNSMTSGASLVRGTFLCAEEGEGGYIVNDDNGMPFVVDYLEIADIPDNVIRFTFSDQNYNPITAGVGPHGTWTKVDGSAKNEWDWITEGITEGTGEFNGVFNDTDNMVEIRCSKFTNNLYGYKLFANNNAISKVELYGFDGLYGSMERMFYYCENATEIVLKGNYSGLSSATETFRGCYNAKKIQIDSLGGCTDANRTFYYCENLETFALNEASDVLEFNSTFGYCVNLESISLDCSGATRFDYTFYNCSSLKNVVLTSTDNATYMYGMFRDCESLKTAPKMSTNRVTDMTYMFANCTSLKDVPRYNTSNVKYFLNMFDQCTALEHVPNFDTSKAESIIQMFRDCENLKDVPNFNTCNIKYFDEAFVNCTSLKSIPLWDTSKAENVTSMFSGCINVENGIKELYKQMSEQVVPPSLFGGCFSNCGVMTPSGVGALTSIRTTWGGLGGLPKSSLLFNFGDTSYDPTATITSNHGTWTRYDTGYENCPLNLWTWTCRFNTWESVFMLDDATSYLSDFENNPVDVIATGDLSLVNCFYNLFCRASALRSCCELVLPYASSAASNGNSPIQGLFSRCENLKVFPHIDVQNLVIGIDYIADYCTNMVELSPMTIGTNETILSARDSFRGCLNVERGIYEMYSSLSTYRFNRDNIFLQCGRNKLTGLSDRYKIPSSWNGLSIDGTNVLVFAFSDTDYDPTADGLESAGSWTRESSSVFNVWSLIMDGTDLSGLLEGAFNDENNKTYILYSSTSNLTDVDNFLKGNTYIRHGALDIYNQMSGQTTPPSNHEKTFHDCGKLTEQGLFELLQIPVNWGGDVLTFCIENNLVAYLPDENQTEVIVQSIRYYQDVFRMMKNSDL